MCFLHQISGVTIGAGPVTRGNRLRTLSTHWKSHGRCLSRGGGSFRLRHSRTLGVSFWQPAAAFRGGAEGASLFEICVGSPVPVLVGGTAVVALGRPASASFSRPHAKGEEEQAKGQGAQQWEQRSWCTSWWQDCKEGKKECWCTLQRQGLPKSKECCRQGQRRSQWWAIFGHVQGATEAGCHSYPRSH